MGRLLHFPQQGEVLRPMHFVAPQLSVVSEETPRPKELRLGWKVVGVLPQPPAPRSSPVPAAALTATLASETLRGPAGFHPELG